MAKKAASPKAPTKSEILNNLSERTGLNKKDVQSVMDALTAEIENAIGKKGPGVFTLPGLCKIQVKHKAATKKKQVRNPRTGEMQWSGPKPASKVVKIRPLKAMKEMV
jgi:nucleoid DNA-binding protein